MFGNPEVLPVKVHLGLHLLLGRAVPSSSSADGSPTLAAFAATAPTSSTACCRLNTSRCRRFLRDWWPAGRRPPNPAVMLDQAQLTWFAELNRSLHDPLDDAQFPERVRSTTAQLSALALEIVETACAECPGLDASAVKTLLPEPAAPRDGSMLFAAA